MAKLLKARRFIVRGDVQGVGYRFFAVRTADRLGITGWVRNLPDGDVEAYAEGEEKDLEAFHQDLLQGPVMARVSGVTIQEERFTGKYESFEVTH